MICFLKYTEQPEILAKRLQLFSIALMKMASAFYCEVVLIIMITRDDSISDIIKDFVVLGFITEIDNTFAANLNLVNSKELIGQFKDKLIIPDSENYREKIIRIIKSMCGDKHQKEIDKRSFGRKMESALITILFAIINEFYIVVYYYSFFYVAVLINILYYK